MLSFSFLLIFTFNFISVYFIEQAFQKAKENGICFQLMAKLAFCYLAIYDNLTNCDSSKLCYGNNNKNRRPT